METVRVLGLMCGDTKGSGIDVWRQKGYCDGCVETERVLGWMCGDRKGTGMDVWRQ